MIGQFGIVPIAKFGLFDVSGRVVATGFETFETGEVGLIALGSDGFEGGFAFVVG